jgi:hypothetical protein
MGMNPETNMFEELHLEGLKDAERDQREVQFKKQLEQVQQQIEGGLLRPDGSPVPKHWSVFQVGEAVVIKDYTFRVAYIGESVNRLSYSNLLALGW